MCTTRFLGKVVCFSVRFCCWLFAQVLFVYALFVFVLFHYTWFARALVDYVLFHYAFSAYVLVVCVLLVYVLFVYVLDHVLFVCSLWALDTYKLSICGLSTLFHLLSHLFS